MPPIKQVSRLGRRSIREIESDPVLMAYGAALSAAYLLTALFFLGESHLLALLSREAEPICWPFFESCYRYRFLSNLQIQLLAIGFGLAALVPFVAFHRRKARLGFWSLLAVAVAHVAIICQDFRNTQNQHYMLLWAVFAFLFWPGKRAVLQYLVLSFYFWAGRLKLQDQWLSGHDLYRKLWLVPDELKPLACKYVVVLELAMIWGLVARSRAWFWATLAQLALFHLISTSQIGTYYPLLAASLLSIYPLSRLLGARKGRGAPPAPRHDFLGRFLRLPPSGWALIGAFAFFQLYPSAVSRDRVLSGVGRTFALNMFEGIYECDVRWTEHYKDGRLLAVNAYEHHTERIECEPIYYYSKTLNRCRAKSAEAGFEDLDLFMDIRLKGDPLPPRKLIDQPSFCSHPPSFNLFLPNPWIEHWPRF